MKLEFWALMMALLLISVSIGAVAHAYAQADQPVKKEICHLKMTYIGVIDGEHKWVVSYFCFFPED